MLEKTLFGNYKRTSVENYIQQLKQEYDESLEKLQHENKQLKAQLEDKKNQESEIGEAIIYAKMMLRESREEAQRQASEILNTAHEEYNEMQQSMVNEISALTEKRIQAERIYQERVAEIKKTLDSLTFDLQEEVMVDDANQSQKVDEKNNVIHFNNSTQAS